MSKDQKQHYIPEFYQKQWAGSDGRLCEYSIRYKGVEGRMTHPAGSGYKPGVYTIPGVSPEIANYTENVFLSRVDTGASAALTNMLSPDPEPWNTDLKSEWIRFLMSLMHRTPERVAYLKSIVEAEYPKLIEEYRAKWPDVRRPSDPETFEEFQAKTAPNPSGRAHALLLQKLIDSKLVGEHIGKMQWRVLTLSNAPHPFLTSDRPIIMTNGLTGPDAHFGLPISPQHVFLATTNEETFLKIQAIDPNQLLQNVNNKVASQAVKYVYGCDDSQIEFVAERIGMAIPSTPLETRTTPTVRR
jgi:hypothetical protein